MGKIAADTRQICRRAAETYPIRILHLIETGGPGGAERLLLDLARLPLCGGPVEARVVNSRAEQCRIGIYSKETPFLLLCNLKSYLNR